MNELEVFKDSQIDDIRQYLSNIDMIPHKAEIQAKINDKAAEIKQSIVDADDKKNCKSVQKSAKVAIEDTETGRVAISQAFRKVGDDFKHEVDEMLKPITDIIDDMKAQVKAIEAMDKDAKRLAIYNQIIEPTYQSRGLDPKKAVVNDDWLKTSISHHKILDEIVAYADAAVVEQKHLSAAHVSSNGKVINENGEVIGNAKRYTITLWDDADKIEDKLMALEKSPYVISVRED